jgi:hypothetical protein
MCHLCVLCDSVVNLPDDQSPQRHRDHRGCTEIFKPGKESESQVDASAHQPGGLADSSRWLQRSENHRTNQKRVAPRRGARNLKENLALSSGTRRVRSSCLSQPVVFALLRPPATFYQPCGLLRTTVTHSPSARRETLPAEFPRGQLSSCASCLLSACRAVCVCARCRRRSISQ